MADINDSDEPANRDIPGVSSDHYDRMMVFRLYPRVKATVLAYEREKFELHKKIIEREYTNYGHSSFERAL